MTTFNVAQSQSNLSYTQKRAVLARLLREKASRTKSCYPLSYGQQALYFLYQSAPTSSAYNTAFTVRIHSNVDVPALKNAFQKLISRHPSLRTTFLMRNGEPVQEVHGYQEVYFEEIDASSWSEDELNERVIEAYQRPFDLERGPVLRVTLFSRSDRDRLLLLNIHHIVSDGWSLWMLLEELRVLYTAQTTSQKALLPQVALTYTDYGQWQTDMLASAQGEQLWNYWKNKLSGELPTFDLPTDRPRVPVQTYHGASCPLKLNETLTQQLKQLAHNQGTTLYTLLLAAFQVLLHRYTGQEDILVGSPTAGRNQVNFAGIVGYFVNPVVLRGNLAGNPTFKDFLGQVRQTALEAIAHQDYPFPLLVERLQPNRDPSRSPLFQVLFVLQKPHKKELADLITPSETETHVGWGGLELEFFPMTTEEGQFDLTLEMVEAKESLFSLFKYNSDLFDAATITQMAGHFQTLLESICANPRQPISELPLLSPKEQDKLLFEWNDLQADYSLDKCIHQMFEEQVDHAPDAVAVIFEKQKLTYRELNNRANQLANYLTSLGVKADTFVGICVERSLDMLVGILGILKAGGAYVPLDPSNPQDRLEYILENAQVRILVTESALLKMLPVCEQIVCLDADNKTIAQYSEANPVGNVQSNNSAYMIYTSGSTGKPKGVLVNHHNVVRLFTATESWYQFKEKDVWTLFHSFAFDFSVWELWGALFYGGRLVVVPYLVSRDPEAFYNLLIAEQVTVLNQTPSAFYQLIKADENSNLREKLSLRLVIFGGEALNLSNLQPWFERHGDQLPQLVNMYGITETTVHVTYRPLTLADVEATGSLIGFPIPDLQIYLLDRYRQPVPIGVPGEMYIGGAGVSQGYWQRDQLTQERFISNPFSQDPNARLYKSGDLARYLNDGSLEYIGRIDNQVKVRGFRIELGEIEAVLVQHPKVREAVVIARDIRPGEKHLVAYVVPPQEPPASNELRRFLKEQLPDYMAPSTFVVLDALPLTPNGKVDRRALPAPDLARCDQGASLLPPRDALEWQLLQIWEDVLNVHPIGVRDDFFEFGGHSLLAVRLMAKIQEKFGQNIPLAALFQNSTIERLAELLQQQTDALPWSPLVTIQAGGTKPPFFCLPGAGGNVIYFYDLARRLGEDQPVYGLQAIGLDGEAQPLTCIEDLAAHYREVLQDVQPQGPYYLGGHSSGGLVAFEMAQQLRDRGHQVALVAIFDSEAPVPGRPPVGLDWDNARWLTRIASVVERFLGKNLDVSYDALRCLEPDEQFNYVGERLKASDLLPPEAGVKQVRALLQVFKANYQAAACYLPGELSPTPITVFRATEIHYEDTGSEMSAQLQKEPTWGWNQLAVDPVDLHIVPGDHITMFAEPNVQVLAEKLKTCIERSQHC